MSKKVERKGVHVSSPRHGNLKKKKGPSSGKGGRHVHKEQGQTEVETRTQWWTQFPAIASDDSSMHNMEWGMDVGHKTISDWTWPDSD